MRDLNCPNPALSPTSTEKKHPALCSGRPVLCRDDLAIPGLPAYNRSFLQRQAKIILHPTHWLLSASTPIICGSAHVLLSLIPILSLKIKLMIIKCYHRTHLCLSMSLTQLGRSEDKPLLIIYKRGVYG